MIVTLGGRDVGLRRASPVLDLGVPHKADRRIVTLPVQVETAEVERVPVAQHRVQLFGEHLHLLERFAVPGVGDELRRRNLKR